MSCNNTHILFNHDPILDRWEEVSQQITIRKGECLKYLFYPSKNGKYIRNFIVEEGAIFRGSAIALGSDMTVEMSVFLEWSDSEASLQLLGLAKSDASITLDGVGKASSWCQNIRLRVDQTNILLWENARVKWRPVLEVATDSIEGGHSCRIHRISGDALFYLESHGLDRTTAEGMLLEAEIYRHIVLMGENLESLKQEILQKISQK
jgi:Fe-S cluster assembly scaffold protein SufB